MSSELEVLDLGKFTRELENFFFKFLKLDLVFLASLVFSSISSQPSKVSFSWRSGGESQPF